MVQTKTEKRIELEKAEVRQGLMKLTKTQIIDQLMKTVESYAAERAAYEGRLREQERRIKTHTENWSSLRGQLDQLRDGSERHAAEITGQMMRDREGYAADRRRLEAALEGAHRDLEQKGRDFEILATAFEAVKRHYTERG